MVSKFKLRSILYMFASSCALAFSAAVMAADHAESPGANADPDADLADVFIFPSPERANVSVGVITWRGSPRPLAQVDTFVCDPNVLFTYNIDRADANGAFDNIPDVQIFARLGTDTNGNCGVQFQNVPGAGGTYSGAFETVFYSPRGMRGFLGLRNDPFFFDAQGYKALVDSFANAGQSGDLIGAFHLDNGVTPRRDSFSLRNVSVMMFEMDDNVLAPLSRGVRPQVRIWATTGRLIQ